ncbi:MAG: DUF4623 domain-containing protein [Paludibacteraceae bacterium]|nr:DUF4623 domain-containing protein [Paludibacteraceae bacterium]
MKKNLFFLSIALLSMLFVGCNPEKESTVEAKIKSISIKNTTYSGVVDNTTFTVTFNDVAAETSIEAIQFNASLSLGAKLDKDTYDFTQGASEDGKELTQTIKVINGTNEQAYTVVINLLDPVSDPMLDKLIMKKANGEEVRAQLFGSVVAIGMPEETEATFGSISLIPSRATYKFTTMQNDKISAVDPGQLVIEFMGRTTTLNISFAAAPTPGADFTAAVVHDFSGATGNIPSYFEGEQVRGSDFDGEHVLIVSREGEDKATPRMFKVADLLADNASNPIMLNTTGVEGGTHIVSAGRLTQGHAYICNLETAICDETPLKVYHYASPDAAPEVVLSWNGYINDEYSYAGRLGDNISIDLDESGNGYAFLCKQEPGDKIYRWTVTGFTQFSDVVEIDLGAVCSYYGYVNKVEQGKYIFTSSYVPFVRLMNEDGVQLIDDVEFDWTENDARPNHGVDPRIVTYNRGRYLMFTVANSSGMHWNFGPIVYIIDITDGVDAQAALVKLSEAVYDEEVPWEPSYGYALTTDPYEAHIQASACSAQCNAAEVNGKLVVFTAAVNAGFALIEFPIAK